MNLGGLLDCHRGIDGRNHVLCPQKLRKEHHEVVAADISPLLVKAHEPVGIAVVNNRAVRAAFQDEIVDIGQICLQRLGRSCKDSARGAVYARGIHTRVRKESRSYHRSGTAAAIYDHAELFADVKAVQNLLLMRRYYILRRDLTLIVPCGVAVIFTAGGRPIRCPFNRRNPAFGYRLLFLRKRGSVGI